MKRRVPLLHSLFVPLMLFALLAGTACAARAQIPVDPMPPVSPILPEPWPPEPWPPGPIPPVPPVIFPVAVELYQVSAVVDGPIASVNIKQVFRNDSSVTSEGTYIFPLPLEALPSSLQLLIDGEMVEGQMYDRDEARSIYENIVRRERDPALLEYLGDGLFQINVFPIPAGKTRTVELTYEHTVTADNGLYKYVAPLRAWVQGSGPAETVSVSVELVNQPGLRTIYSPSHEVSIERTGDDAALIGFEGNGVDSQSDSTIYFGTDESTIGANLISYKPAGEDGYFMLLVAPSLDAADEEIVERDLVLVVDVSGSMQGEKIQQAKQAARFVVSQLNQGDRFNLITFSTGTRLWQRELQEVDAESLSDAERWIGRIAATGSTDINRALLEAMAQFDEDRTRPGYILFLTDGQPTMGETDPEQIIENAADNQPDERSLRIFTFGVGFDVNTDLLSALSRDMGGRATYVKPDQDIEEIVGDFASQISKPVLSDVMLAFGGDMVVDELYPFPLTDLFAGEQLLVVGRYREGGVLDLEIGGKVNGEPTTYVYPGQELVDRGGEPFVARLWATRKMGALLEQIRREGTSQELVDEITELSLEYGIVSPFTSYLVLEPGMAQGAPAAIVPLSSGRTLRADASGAAVAAAESMAAAPAAGESAVAAAEARSSLESAQTVTQEEQVRYLEGKTFVRRGWVEDGTGKAVPFWVDTSVAEDVTPEVVEFGSERYFELVQDETVARWLALSPEMIVVVEGKTLRITTQTQE